MGYTQSHRAIDPVLFIVNNQGLVVPFSNSLYRAVDWETTVETVDVSSIGEYLPRNIEVARSTIIEVNTYGRGAFSPIPDEGILNIAIGDISYCVKYNLEASSVSYPDHEVVESEYRLIATGGMLSGEHAPQIRRVRFDVGDGTFRVQYALEREVDLVVERWYNQQGVYQWK